MVKKSKDAYRNIREVSDQLGLEPHVLRFWESKFDSLQPMTLGGGRRFYSKDDIELIQTIRELLYSQGLTIKAASRLIKLHGIEAPNYAVANDKSRSAAPSQAKPSASPQLIRQLSDIDQILADLAGRAQAAIARYDGMLNNIPHQAR